MKTMLLAAALALVVAHPVALGQTPAAAPARPLAEQVAAILAAAPAGTRWGVLVTTADGHEVLSINPDQRFIPGSNTKLFTTAAAYASLDMAAPDVAGGAGVALEPATRGVADVALYGRGDPALSIAPDCKIDCLATLADAVAAKTRRVRDVIGDDTWYPDERWSPGMSWNNIVTDSGTAISALSVADNVVELVVNPAVAEGEPQFTLSPYFQLDNQTTLTWGSGKNILAYDRPVHGRTVRVTGKVAMRTQPWRELIGIDDPAHFAGWHFRRMLEERGVKVQGEVRSRHRALKPIDDPAQRTSPLPIGPDPVWLARLTAPPLAADIAIINKVSQNLHADLLLRRLGKQSGSGSIADGIAALRAVLERAGVPRAGYDFSDGSGMSSYNRVSPRAAVALLRWGAGQSWGTDWRASFPVGGVDGTLRHRFAGTSLQGRIQAKTGTLNATNALSGYLTAASGQELNFSIFANDVPDGGKAVQAMDAALLAIAAAN